MKKSLTIISFLFLLCSTMFGQQIATPKGYELNMTVKGVVSINGEEQDRPNLIIAAYCGEELRGSAKTFKVDLGNDNSISPFILTIGANTNNETIKFRLIDEENGKEYGSNYTLTFKANAIIGTDQNPENIDFIPMYWEEDNVVIHETSMTVNAIIAIDGQLQNRSDLEVAAFYGNELRAIGRPIYVPSVAAYMTFLVINGEGNDNETITFKLYDHSEYIPSESMPLDSDYSVDFEINKIIGKDSPFTLNFVYNSVAKIENNYYASLAEAVEAAGTGEIGTTITLLKDVEGSGVVINKNVTIDFGGFTYTFTEPAVGSTGTESNGFQILNGNTVTLQNGKLEVAETEAENFYILIQNYANLTVNNMNLDGTNLDKWVADYEDSYVLSNNSGNVNIINSTIIANDEGAKAFAFDACKYANYEAPVVTVNTTGEIKGAVEVSATLNLLAVGTNNITRVEVTGEGQIYNEIAVENVVVKKVYTNDGDGNAENDWYTIAVPSSVAIENSGLITTESDYALYRYAESNIGEEWINYKNASSNFGANLEATTGYLYANAAAETEATYKISLNTEETHTMSISATAEAGDLAGFHLVGNPFSHDIKFANLNHASLAQGFYVLERSGAWMPRNNEGTIKAFQGALIQVGGEGQLAINKNTTQSRANSEDNGSLAINVANSRYSDVAYVSFNEGLGLTKISHRNAEIPMVYIPVDGKNYAVATMSNDVEEIPFSFEAKTMGEYTISIDAENSDFARVILVDRLTGEETNMLFEDYTFMAKSNDDPNRFIIKLTSNSEMNSDNNFVYIYKNELFISNSSDNAVVEIYDISGRPIATYNINGSTNISMDNFSNGIYIVRMMNENDVKVQKITID